MDFSHRYQQLNARQRDAVDTIEGPVMVIAGPGTGKTELLSMRAANILKKLIHYHKIFFVSHLRKVERRRCATD